MGQTLSGADLKAICQFESDGGGSSGRGLYSFQPRPQGRTQRTRLWPNSPVGDNRDGKRVVDQCASEFMATYYNENDPKAAAWLRQLIANHVIAPGEVDERSIEDVRPSELSGFTQCHFFAGIGVWSYALRQAGWSDSQSVWTGSCPCQPFSTAGKRGGTSDERHLWPAFFHLIEQCKPSVVFGEQVASKDGLAWLDIVQADVEAKNYSFGALDLCAAGIGAPHIRQRLYFVAESEHARLDGEKRIEAEQGSNGTENGILVGGDYSLRSTVEYAAGSRREGNLEGALFGGRNTARAHALLAGSSSANNLAHPKQPRWEGRLSGRENAEREAEHGCSGRDSAACKLAYADIDDSGNRQEQRSRRLVQLATDATAGFWSNADWIYCRDGKYRPVEPGTFPLADGIAGRVGLLRGYGNALAAPIATAFIEAYRESKQLSLAA